MVSIYMVHLFISYPSHAIILLSYSQDQDCLRASPDWEFEDEMTEEKFVDMFLEQGEE